MADLQQSYREALVARIDALEAAKRAFEAGDETAGDSIRRITHNLKGSGST